MGREHQQADKQAAHFFAPFIFFPPESKAHHPEAQGIQKCPLELREGGGLICRGAGAGAGAGAGRGRGVRE